MNLIITAKGWAIVVGLALVAAAGLGSYLAQRKPGPCVDSVEFVRDNTGFVPGTTCSHADHRLEMYPYETGVFLVKCICRRGAP